MTPRDIALEAVDAIADRFLVGKHIPGVVYGVVSNGELIHSRGIGTLRVGEDAPPDPDSIFRIASMTKSFTAATLIKLRDDGLLGLDDPVAQYVPELADLRGPTADSPVITVRHLLTMASGLATDDPWGDRQQGLDLGTFSKLLSGPLTFAWPPGTRFEYSNLGYGILGRLITNVAGAEYRDVVREKLLAPLGMEATTYLVEEVEPARLAHGHLWRDDAYIEEPIDPYGALASMGGIFTSVRDLARWVGFFTDSYPPRDDPEGASPLSRASRREMQQAAGAGWPSVILPSPDADPDVAAGGYGYGLFVEDHIRWGRMVTHSGGYPGFGSNMRWQPASGLGVIVLANHRYAPTTLLARQVMTSLLEAGVVPPRPIRPADRLVAARADIDRLLDAWDDGIAARLFTMNVEFDEPLAHRRDALKQIREVHGTVRTDSDVPEQAHTPLHVMYWLADDRGGRVRVEIRLSPEELGPVQTFNVQSIPAPSERLERVATAITDGVNAESPALPNGINFGSGLDQAALARVVRILAARFAPVALGPVMGGDGEKSATWWLRSERGELELAITMDASSDLVTALTLVQRAPTMPQHDN